MKLVTSMDWMGKAALSGEASILLMLLDQDVASVQLSFSDYEKSMKELLDRKKMEIDEIAQARVFHNAKVFVSAVRRVGRLGEALCAKRNEFGAAAKAVQLAWRKKKAAFDKYIEPRNAIEHIDGEVDGNAVTYIMNLENNSLKVTDEEQHSADISLTAVDMVLSLRNDIVQSVVTSNA